MKKFLQGLIVAAAGGAVAVLNDPHEVAKNPIATGKVAAAGAVIGIVAWLVKSPIVVSDSAKKEEIK